ncbi:MAG: hydrogenase iron-sulfur subunit [Deltaproteobacteria bacterium]|nr:hydrogenase iron-sulfur subunit [Deltaproteobacteria bacterium]
MTEAPIKIIGFCCKNAIEKDPVLAEKGWHAFEPAIKILSLPCSSKVETLGIIKAFEAGSDGIFVLGCKEKTCRLLDGNARAQRTVNYTKKLLKEINLETDRLIMIQLGAPEFKDFNQVAGYMIEHIQTLGKVS